MSESRRNLVLGEVCVCPCAHPPTGEQENTSVLRWPRTGAAGVLVRGACGEASFWSDREGERTASQCKRQRQQVQRKRDTDMFRGTDGVRPIDHPDR